jgi:hypothetical protein
MSLKKVISQALLVVLLFAGAVFSDPAEAAPCPPTLFVDGSSSVGSDCSSTISTIAKDTEYGPTQISGGQCPRIPASFPATYLVRSESEFADAYSRVNPGEAIVIRDGNYTWNTDRTLNKKGTSDKPIYIVYQTLRGAVFSNNAAEFRVTGSHHVIAGFRFNNSKDEVFRINGPNNRIACHYMQTSGGKGYVYLEGGGSADNTEIDNNVFDNHNGIAVNIVRCNPQEPTCTNNPVGTHIHHNTWKNKERLS